MPRPKTVSNPPDGRLLPKCPTGIAGFDEITLGGLPRGRPTLICGGPGCGKTLLGIEFLSRGALQFNEPGVCMTFEESVSDLEANAASLGFDLSALIRAKKIAIDHVEIERHQIAETGDYDLEGLFIRLNRAIESVGAKRVLLDTIEALFAGLKDEGIMRSEVQRLFRWLKEKGITALITAEQGAQTLTRYGLEEYVSDCVIFLDHRVQDSVVTRRLRIVKYRGSNHGTNEYPFLIGETGLSVLPVTSLRLAHEASSARISSGVSGLDEMLEGKGFYVGSSILVSGTAGAGKTSLAAHFVDAACRRGENALFFAFEESPSQLTRNMKSIGVDLDRWAKKGLLRVASSRPSVYGLEMHLVQMHTLLNRYKPRVVVVDAISSLIGAGLEREVKSMLLRLIDWLKNTGTTALMTWLNSSTGVLEGVGLDVSSLVDTWLLLRDIESCGERNKILYVLKSRGMAHSNQVRELRFSPKGVVLRDAYAGPGKVMMGSARTVQEAEDREAERIEARIATLQSEREANRIELAALEGRRKFQRSGVEPGEIG